jgi:phage terminase large subunit-like protein
MTELLEVGDGVESKVDLLANQYGPLHTVIDDLRLRRRTAGARRDKAAKLDVVDWIESHFWIPEPDETGRMGPIRLFPHQRWMLREAHRRDENGQFVYSTIVWSDIKKSAKSSIAGAVARHRAETVPFAEVYCIANDLKQAESRVFAYMLRSMELDPAMHKGVDWRVAHRKASFTRTSSWIEAIPIDPTGEAGSNADLTIWSELWGSHHAAQQKMWAEMTIPPTKFGYSQRWVETYAGYFGESPTLWDLHQAAILDGRPHPDAPMIPVAHADGLETPLRVYENPDAGLLVMWNEEPRLPWQTPAYYKEEEHALPPNEFERLHRNQWISSVDAFVPPEWWNACAVTKERGTSLWDAEHDCPRPPLADLTMPMILGADASITADNTALVGVTRHPDKDKHDHVVVRFARRWVPGGRANPIDYDETILPAIDEALKLWRVIHIAYDEYQLHQPMTRLKRRNVVAVKAFGQGKDREIADKQLYDLIRDGKLWFYPDEQPRLTEHVRNANRKPGTLDRDKLRIIKRQETLPIDLAVALSMAAQECLRLNL